MFIDNQDGHISIHFNETNRQDMLFARNVLVALQNAVENRDSQTTLKKAINACDTALVKHTQ